MLGEMNWPLMRLVGESIKLDEVDEEVGFWDCCVGTFGKGVVVVVWEIIYSRAKSASSFYARAFYKFWLAYLRFC